MFQLMIHHNEEDSFETLGEAIARINRHGLKVVHTTYNPTWDEHTLVVQGTQEGFLSWHTECMEGGPSIEVEEFLEELIEVEDLTAA
jgi:nicotinamidase-related amidase